MNLKENKKTEKNTVELVVEVKGDEFKTAVDNAFKKNLSKMKRFLKENEIETIDFIFNNSFFEGGLWLCGTRGWMLETTSATEHDKKIIARECARLERSLASAGDGEKIAFLHYPPIYDGNPAREFIDVMQRYGVKRCFYGHLHAGSIKNATVGTHFDINFSLVSADAIDFLPINIQNNIVNKLDNTGGTI